MENTPAFAMLQSLKVQELQQILSFANQQRVGKKMDLIRRCMKLLERPNDNLEEKIKEIYYQRHPVGLGFSKPVGVQLKSLIPICPDVQFVPLVFFDQIGELMRPMSLSSGSDKCAWQGGTLKSTHFVFHLSPQEAQDVATSRDFIPHLQLCQYIVQVQLRFCILPSASSVLCEDNLPPNLCVFVNGRAPTLPPPKPTSRPDAEIIRPGRPIDISALCKLNPMIANRVDLSWAVPADVNAPQNYCVGVFLVRKVSVDTLLCRLRLLSTRHADFTRALIKEKLSPSNSRELLEITTNNLHASLHCPLSKGRMQVPGRSKACKHIQCFDIEAFLKMNEKKPTWICPVCDIKTPYDSLMIDGLFLEILANCDSNIDEVEFDSQANYKYRSCARSKSKVEFAENDSTTVFVDNAVGADNPKRKRSVDIIVISSDESDSETTVPESTSNQTSVEVPRPSMTSLLHTVDAHKVPSRNPRITFPAQKQSPSARQELQVDCSVSAMQNSFSSSAAPPASAHSWDDDVIILTDSES